MNGIYFAVSGSKLFKDQLNAMKTFFEGGGFSTAFTVAIVVAAALCLIYYILCRFSFTWAKISTWVATLILAGVVSFFVTGITTGITDKKHGKVYEVVEKQWKKKVTGMTPEQIQAIQPEKKKIVDNLNKGMFGCNPINRLCYSNFFYTMLLFYVFSLIINGFSGYGVNIPHRGLFRL